MCRQPVQPAAHTGGRCVHDGESGRARAPAGRQRSVHRRVDVRVRIQARPRASSLGVTRDALHEEHPIVGIHPSRGPYAPTERRLPYGRVHRQSDGTPSTCRSAATATRERRPCRPGPAEAVHPATALRSRAPALAPRRRAGGRSPPRGAVWSGSASGRAGACRPARASLAGRSRPRRSRGKLRFGGRRDPPAPHEGDVPQGDDAVEQVQRARRPGAEACVGAAGSPRRR